MSPATSPQLELLRAKLALAIGDIECNLAYNEIRAARPNALDEPWSNDMSGPHKHIGKLLSSCDLEDVRLISTNISV